MIRKEKIMGLHLGTGFREWEMECKIDESKPESERVLSCKPLKRGGHPYVLQNGIPIKTEWGLHHFDLIQLSDGTKILYPDTKASFV